MLRKPLILLLIGCLSLSYAYAPQNPFTVNNGSIDFNSDAPMELISASSNQLKGMLNPEKKQFFFTVNINSFKGFNSRKQQQHFNETYLESDKFPIASFEGKVIEDVNLRRDGYYAIRAKGNLFIHGVIQERIIKCYLNIKNGVISVKSNFTVLLADHNIQIPKILSEKLASEIKVEVKAELADK